MLVAVGKDGIICKGCLDMEILLTESMGMASLAPISSSAASQRKRCMHTSQNVLSLALQLGDSNPSRHLLIVTSIATILHLTLPMMRTTKSWLALPFLVKACSALQSLKTDSRGQVRRSVSPKSDDLRWRVIGCNNG